MNQEHMDHTEDRAELNELMAVRREKLRDLIEMGIDPSVNASNAPIWLGKLWTASRHWKAKTL